uniref:retroviral-like aspartic protease family protein n=1 Tax=Prevotella pectinovora TaxID=1602169 RepID=UPI003A8D00D3
SDYDHAYKTNKGNEYMLKKCDIYNLQGKYDEVNTILCRLLEKDKTDPVLWVYLARNETEKGKFDSAIEKCTYAITLDPNYSSAYSFRATPYIEQHKYKEAVDDVIKALSINDSDTRAQYHMIELADKAFDLLSAGLKAQQVRDGKNPLWSYNLGYFNAYKSRHAEAEQAFRKALAISQEEGVKYYLRNIYGRLSYSLNEQGKYQEALQYADEALAEDSTYAMAYSDKANAYYSLNKTMMAIDVLTEAIKQCPDEISFYDERARMYMYAGLYRNALDDINLAISMDNEDVSYLMLRVEIYQRMKRYEEAQVDCENVIRIETQHPEEIRDKQMLTYAYIRSGDKANALNTIKDVYEEDPDAEDEYDLACMYSLMDLKEEALGHFGCALSKGYCDFVHIDNDTDLDNIREIKRFAQLIEEYKAKRLTKSQLGNEVGLEEYDEKVVEVPFTKDAGICKVKCTINGLPLHSYFDTGATDVTISNVEAQFMIKNDYLNPTDVKGSAYYSTADGNITAGTVILLRKVDFGGLELTNVRASVVDNQQAPLLLGQSVLSKLGKVEIDNEKHVLKITTRIPKKVK